MIDTGDEGVLLFFLCNLRLIIRTITSKVITIAVYMITNDFERRNGLRNYFFDKLYESDCH